MAKTPEEMPNEELLRDLWGVAGLDRGALPQHRKLILERMAPTPPAPIAAQTENCECNHDLAHHPTDGRSGSDCTVCDCTGFKLKPVEQVDAARCPACGGKVQFDDLFQPMCIGACGGKWHIEHMEVSDFAQFFRAASLKQKTQPPSEEIIPSCGNCGQTMAQVVGQHGMPTWNCSKCFPTPAPADTGAAPKKLSLRELSESHGFTEEVADEEWQREAGLTLPMGATGAAEWIRVEDELPKPGQTVDVLLCGDLPATVEVVYPVANPWRVHPFKNEHEHVITHWKRSASTGDTPQPQEKSFDDIFDDCHALLTTAGIPDTEPNFSGRNFLSLELRILKLIQREKSAALGKTSDAGEE